MTTETTTLPARGAGHLQGPTTRRSAAVLSLRARRIVTGDNGVTWTVLQVAGSTPPKNDDLVDPSVGIGSQGRLYFGYEGSDGHPWIAVSDDKGVNWRNNQDVGATLGIKNSTFPEVVAGDNDRAAYAFLGSMTDGYYGDPIGFGGLWHLYVATTYDGGIT